MRYKTMLLLTAVVLTSASVAATTHLNPQPMPPGAHASTSGGAATNFNCWPHKHVLANGAAGQANGGNSQVTPCGSQVNHNLNKSGPNSGTTNVQSPRD